MRRKSPACTDLAFRAIETRVAGTRPPTDGVLCATQVSDRGTKKRKRTKAQVIHFLNGATALTQLGQMGSLLAQKTIR